MKFKSPILFLVVWFSIGTSIAQSDPTLVSYQADTVCENTYETGFYNIVVQDLDNDSTYINVIGYNNTLIDLPFVVVPDTYDAGSPIRTFKIEFYGQPGIPAGVTLSNVDIEIVGGGGDDFTTFVTLNGVGASQGPVVTFDMSSMIMCDNDNPIDLSAYVSPTGGIFDYGSFGAKTTGYLDPEVFFADMGDGIYYTYTDLNGCSATQYYYPPTAFAPTVFVSANSSTCGNADGSAVATIGGGALPFSVYWSTGFAETVSSSSIVNNLSSGNYYINIEDANGCKAVGIAQVSDGDLDVTETVTDETCVGQSHNGAIDLTILSSLGTVDYISWSNGEITEDITGLTAGDYQVQIHTTMNCQGFYTFAVGSLPKLGVTVDAMLPADCTVPDGGNSGIQITTNGGSGSYLWSWNTGATTEDIDHIPAGLYTCVLTDAVTGCTWSWSKDLEAYNGPYINVDQVTKPNCNTANGAIEVSISSPNSIVSTSWSSGHSTEDINGIPSGTYHLTALDMGGCVGTKKVVVANEKPYQPSICLLTVDTTLVYNLVVWEKDITQNVAGFNVYRETPTFGVFEKVATRPYALESFYEDNLASPQDRSWRYYITTYDDCGGESFGSFVHKTIHVVANTTNGTDFDLSWDDYEGISYSTVNLLRYDDVNGWVSVATLGAGVNTFPDTPPVVAGLDYMVSFNLSNTCTSTKTQDYNSSRSNKTASVFDPGGSTAEISDEELGYISIYPNPASDVISLHVDMPELFQYYRIVNLNGEEISNGSIFTNNTNISLETMASGVYVIQLVSDSKIIQEKFVKN